MCDCTRRAAVAGIAAAVAAVATPVRAAAPDAHREFIAAAFKMKEEALRRGDQAFGAVVVQDGRIVGYGPSRVVLKQDAAAHAEREAIREAQARLGTSDLSGAVLYSSSRACGACENAAAQAKMARMFYGTDATDAGAPRRF
jgi:tRNA(Arg) A34 adenosine deaminase TadA